MAAAFSGSAGWNVLTSTLLSALIHSEDKAASMPQCLSCKPTLWELQSTVPPPQCLLFFPPQRGFAPASDKRWEEDETEDSAAQPLSKNMKDFWKVNSCAEERYTRMWRNPNFWGFVLFFSLRKRRVLSEYRRVLLSHRNNIVYKNTLPTSKRPSHDIKTHSEIPEQSQRVCEPWGAGSAMSPNIPRGSSVCVCVCANGDWAVAPVQRQACVWTGSPSQGIRRP